MKEVELNLRVDTEICERIVRELAVLKQVKKCLFIIDYYGALYSQNIIYIFMEHMDVGALDQVGTLSRCGSEADSPPFFFFF